MLHNVTQPMCLQDLMWWFVDAMNKNPENNMKKRIEKPEVCIFFVSIIKNSEMYACNDISISEYRERK